MCSPHDRDENGIEIRPADRPRAADRTRAADVIPIHSHALHNQKFRAALQDWLDAGNGRKVWE